MDNQIKQLTEIKALLQAQKPFLKQKYKVKQLGIFGSYTRGEQTAESDVDVLLDYEEAPSLFTLIEMESYLSDMLGVKVDLVTRKGLKPQLRDYILGETVYL